MKTSSRTYWLSTCWRSLQFVIQGLSPFASVYFVLFSKPDDQGKKSAASFIVSPLEAQSFSFSSTEIHKIPHTALK